jgi:thiosulfate dehydrogenase [quinone] large subunit
LIALIFLRLLIGWHFLYEGLSKVLNPYWTSANYLLESKWIFSSWFISIVGNPAALKIVDSLNEWGLIAIGAGLIAGCFTRLATIAGIVLLSLYYVATPPLAGLSYSLPAEGSYLLVNKNLIELAALIVLVLFPTENIAGLDVFIFKKKAQLQQT